MKFAVLRDLLQFNIDPDLLVDPGPRIPDHPGSFVVLTRTGGPGMDVDGVVDQIGYQVRCVGEQNDFSSAEDLAMDIDRVILSLYSGSYGGRHLVSAYRQGSGPTPLLEDDADRTHFVCNYIFAVQSVLTFPRVEVPQ